MVLLLVYFLAVFFLYIHIYRTGITDLIFLSLHCILFISPGFFFLWKINVIPGNKITHVYCKIFSPADFYIYSRDISQRKEKDRNCPPYFMGQNSLISGLGRSSPRKQKFMHAKTFSKIVTSQIWKYLGKKKSWLSKLDHKSPRLKQPTVIHKKRLTEETKRFYHLSVQKKKHPMKLNSFMFKTQQNRNRGELP